MRCPTLADLPPPPEGKTGWPWTKGSPKFPEKMPDGREWPKVSIITPSYQQGRFIEETIRSVLLQNYPNIEYIVVDGGSQDDTLSILDRYRDYVQWISEADHGQADAINKGWRRATGEILAYLNSDDTYACGAVGQAVRFITENPDVAMAYGDIAHIDQESEVTARYYPGPLSFEKYLCCDFYLPQPTVFFRTAIASRIGYLDPVLNLALDLDYWIRIMLEQRVEYIPATLANARIYNDAKSIALKYKYIGERLYVLDKLFSRPELPENVSALRSKCYSSAYLQGACDYIRIGDLSMFWKYLKKSLRLNCAHCSARGASILVTSLRTYGIRGIITTIQANSKIYHDSKQIR